MSGGESTAGSATVESASAEVGAKIASTDKQIATTSKEQELTPEEKKADRQPTAEEENAAEARRPYSKERPIVAALEMAKNFTIESNKDDPNQKVPPQNPKSVLVKQKN